MNNSYEMADILELGKAKQMVLGSKYLDAFSCDMVLGTGFGTWFSDDVDENEE